MLKAQAPQQLQKSERIVYLDLLRIFSIFAVVVIHVVSTKWYKADIHSGSWQTLNIYDSLSRWCVPVFAMISGALFLDGKQDTKTIYRKHILRIITAFIFWSLVYAGIKFLQGASWKKCLRAVLTGHYHMWFLYMIVGLYLIVPLLRNLTENRKAERYFLALGFVFSILLPHATNTVGFISSSYGKFFSNLVGKFNMKLVLGYSFYFVLGHYLHHTEFRKTRKLQICLLGIGGFLLTAGLTVLVSFYKGKASGVFYKNFQINVLMEAMAVFLLFKDCFGKKAFGVHTTSVLSRLSKYCFGAYLVHALLVDQLNRYLHLNATSIHPALAVPALSIAVFLASFGISALLNRIPVLNKYIV